MTKREYIQVRVSGDEKDRLVAMAAGCGVSLSGFVRDCVFGARMVVLPGAEVPSGMPPSMGDDALFRPGSSEEVVASPHLPSAAQVAKRSYDPDFK